MVVTGSAWLLWSLYHFFWVKIVLCGSPGTDLREGVTDACSVHIANVMLQCRAGHFVVSTKCIGSYSNLHSDCNLIYAMVFASRLGGRVLFPSIYSGLRKKNQFEI